MKLLGMLFTIVLVGWVSQQQDLQVAVVTAVIFGLSFWFVGGIILAIHQAWRNWEENN